eukprot:TRINITY_DN32721_c0_g1_i1.p1 TRINITY_DN32721_c0_g1~~TRINITY_DN32721_c0_g1_i1.p1  ORF type:complete len:257 (+),score=113.62 TRINITY_DN32721_c0_g1_i1:55-825(+)
MTQTAVLLDPGIREWALIPIVLVTLMLQLVRHYVSVLMKDNKSSSKEFLQEMQTLQRSALCRTNRGWIPKDAFEARRKKYSDAKGLLHTKPTSNEGNPMAAMADPNMMKGMMVQQALSIGPHIGMMTWVAHFFPSFVIAKLPFGLTSRFRGMFQRGIEHQTLEVTYITSTCGYFLFMYGLRGFITLLLGEASDFDEMEHMNNMSQGQMAGGRQQVDMPALFNAEIENWSEALTAHEFHLNGSEKRLLDLPADVLDW